MSAPKRFPHSEGVRFSWGSGSLWVGVLFGEFRKLG